MEFETVIGTDSFTFAVENPVIGDINNDSELNDIDIVLTISSIFENNYIETPDINSDGLLNILVIVLLIDLIL